MRVVASVVILVALVARIPGSELDELWPDWRPGMAFWLALALVAAAVAVVLSAWRWQTVLHNTGMAGTLPRLTHHCFAGQFIGNFLPTTIGGDVLRAARLTKENGDGPGTTASVVLERLTGWVVLPLITMFGFALNSGLLREGYGSRLALAMAVATLGILLVVVYAAEHPNIGGRLAGNDGWRRFTGAVHHGLTKLRRRPLAVTHIVAVGFVYQLVLIGSAILAAEALTLDIGPTALLTFMPMVLVAQVLPLSIGGLGLREGALVIFLGQLGVPNGEAILLGLTFYALNLVVSLAGAPSFAVGAGKRHGVLAQ